MEDLNDMKDSLNINKIGVNIKSLRESRGLSINQLAVKAGVSASYLGRVEKGKRKSPTILTIEKIAKALDVPLERIIVGKKQEKYIRLSKLKELIKETVVNKEEKEKFIRIIDGIFENDSVIESEELKFNI